MAKQRPLSMLVRVATDETEAFRRAADLDGLSLSAWVRSRLLAAARAEGAEPKPEGAADQADSAAAA